MNELEFVFDDSPLTAFLDRLQPGQQVSAAELLTAAESGSQEDLEDALTQMMEMGVVLDMQGLEIPATGDQSKQRLALEEKFAKAGMPLSTLEETDPLRLYLEELAAIPAQGDVQLLAQQVAKANAAGEELTRDHTALTELSLSRVVELAGEQAGRGVLLLDLIQEGSMALWQAVSSYLGGDTFASYRDSQIRFSMMRQILLQAKAAGVGQMLRSAMEDYRSVDEKLLSELGRNPEPEELAQALHLSLSQTQLLAQLVENTRQMGRVTQPEPEELPQEEDQAVEDTAYFQMRQRISDLLSQLTEADAKLISLRYGLEGGLPLKPQQVAAKLGISAEEVVAREAAALSKLREIKE